MVEESLKDRQEWVAMFHYKGDSWKKKKRRGGSARKLIFRSERPRREKRSLRGTKKTLSTFAKEATSLGLVLRKRWERARRVRGLKSKRHNAEDLIYRWWRVSFSTDTIFLSLLDSTLSTSVASYFIPNNLGLDVVSTYFSPIPYSVCQKAFTTRTNGICQCDRQRNYDFPCLSHFVITILEHSSVL